MELTVLVQTVLIIVFTLLALGMPILAIILEDKCEHPWIGLGVYGLTFVVMIVLGRVFRESSVYVFYPDGSHRQSEWFWSFRDSAGNRYPIGKRKTYVFYDGLGEDLIPETCELTVFPVVYTLEDAKIGLAVEDAPSPERISVHPYCLEQLGHYIHYAFVDAPLTQKTESVIGDDIVWCLDYTAHVGTDYVPYYQESVYVMPDLYCY